MILLLLVEDDPIKANKITDVVRSHVSDDALSIRQVTSVFAASEALAGECFDLMILDIVLPLREDSVPQEDGGLQLIRELNKKGHRYKVPAHIIGLTAYEKSQKAHSAFFERELWHLIVFDHASDDWAEAIRRKLDHILGVQARSDAPLAPKPLATTASNPHSERHMHLSSLPGYGDLARAYRGLWGLKVFWLGIFTLAPLFVTAKLPGMRLEASAATIVYAVYHGCSIYVWASVHRMADPTIPLRAGDSSLAAPLRLQKYLLSWLSWLVLLLVSVTLISKVRFVFGGDVLGPVILPSWVSNLLGDTHP